MSNDLPPELRQKRIEALEQALRLLFDTFVVHDFEQAWRWDEEDGEPELVEPYANAALNARFVLDREGWIEHERRSPSPQPLPGCAPPPAGLSAHSPPVDNVGEREPPTPLGPSTCER